MFSKRLLCPISAKPLWRPVATTLLVLLPAAVFSFNTTVRKQDSNDDGQIDRIAFYDGSGRIGRMELDSDFDGVMDRFQYYEDGEIDRLEIDGDGDGAIDSRDFFEEGGRVLHLRLSQPDGHIVERIEFDGHERPLLLKKDTTADRCFDTFFHFNAGKIASITRDLDADGEAEVWTSYRDDLPLEQWSDRNSDGIIESRFFYGPSGLPMRSLHDGDEDGIHEEIRLYMNGELAEQHMDADGDGTAELLTFFSGGLPVKQLHDTNCDGVHDVVTTFRDGTAHQRKKDTDFDQTFDWFCDFDEKGRALRISEDEDGDSTPERLRLFAAGRPTIICDDPDEDGAWETVTIFENALISSQERDTNDDGRMDVTILFDERGLKVRAQIDSNHNGLVDTWELYEDDELVRVDQAPEEKGWAEFRLHYREGTKLRMERDMDGDGRYEQRERYDHPDWSSLIEKDENGDGRPEERIYSRDGVVRLKEFDGNSDGSVALREEYGPDGVIEHLSEDTDGDGKMELAWTYRQGEPVLAELDLSGDGAVDVWFHYEQGKVTRVEEDSDDDGLADIFEKYDTAEVLIERGKDYDGDGRADTWERF